MKKAPLPPNEKERLTALRALEILDTAPEERFDRLTRLAQRLFNVPVALVSLVDSDRQWFKSRVGVSATETPRDISFCGHAVMEQEVFVVKDALADERFWDNPLVTEDPKIRFYAGYPLSAPQGEKVGSFCVIDREPRNLASTELLFLYRLGRLVEHELAKQPSGLEEQLSGEAETKFFRTLLNYLVEYSRAMDFPMSVLLIHLPNFVTTLKTLGSKEADRMIVNASRLLGGATRRSDIIGKYGPDSFYVFLPKCTSTDLPILKARLYKDLSAMNQSGELEVPIQLEHTSLQWSPKGTETVSEVLTRTAASIEDLRQGPVA